RATFGGGLELRAGGASVQNCAIGGNTATSNGGGLDVSLGLPFSITNTVVESNIATSDGGGMSMYVDGTSTLQNCTFSENQAARGRGVAMTDCITSVQNCAFWGALGGTGPEVAILRGNTGSPCQPSLAYCDIEGGQANVLIQSGCTPSWGTAIIADDPNF